MKHTPGLIHYKSRKFKSLGALYRKFTPVAKVPYATFLSRLERGWSMADALEKPKSSGIKIIYNGTKYRSISKLYHEEKKRMRKIRHRTPAISYCRFIETVHKKGVTQAIKLMHMWSIVRKRGNLKRQSKELGGADNLVCQRVTKLGWSLEKAMTTPKGISGTPIEVKYKGVTYRSIAKCYHAVKPKMSITKFAKVLRESGFCVK